ncbi:TPA: dTDP-4-dehydrorhamnose reductase [Pseudomonas putida]|nr:dTDP-4-dehydrorhamnose reductase [Pseudomonas putida]
MRVLLLGKNGQLGWELRRSLAPLGCVIAVDRSGVDLADPIALRVAIRQYKPDLIVNAAAYTSVDKAESEVELVECVNALACEVMAQEAVSLGALLVHYSTDYVFNGQGSMPWRETDAVAPLNRYGLSKVAGEQAIIQSGCRYLIFRSSWNYGAHGENFAKKILQLAREHETLDVVADQVGAPTGVDLIADVTALAIQQVQKRSELLGLYHLAASGEVSWHGYASFVIDFARANGEPLAVMKINPIDTVAHPTIARRPLNSRLDTQKLRDNFSLHLPDWQSGVTRMLREVLNK